MISKVNGVLWKPSNEVYFSNIELCASKLWRLEHSVTSDWK